MKAYKLYTDYCDFGYYGTKARVIEAVLKEYDDTFVQHFDQEDELSSYFTKYYVDKKLDAEQLLKIFDDNCIYVEEIEIEM